MKTLKIKKELIQKIEIPEDVEVILDGAKVTAKGPQGEANRVFDVTGLTFEKKDSTITVKNKKATKNEKRKMNTTVAHIKNMVKGVKNKFEYKLKICFVHFPMTVEIKGTKAIVKNFLGEKTPRSIELPKGAEVKVDKEIITVKSVDKEIAGQAAANLETVTQISKRDRRVFQDGIFITNKCGKEI